MGRSGEVGEHAILWGFVPAGVSLGSRGEGELVAKLVWRVKLVAELQAGVTTEVEVGRFERDEQASVADLGLRLEEAKQLTAALQAEMVSRQVAVVGERHRLCATCGGVLASKGSILPCVDDPVLCSNRHLCCVRYSAVPAYPPGH